MTELKYNRIPWQTVASMHMVIRAAHALYHNLGFFRITTNLKDINEKPVVGYAYFVNNVSTLSLKILFDCPGIVDNARLFGEPLEQFSQKVAEVYGKAELNPILKKYFNLNDHEWHLFTDAMKSTHPTEKIVHLFFEPSSGSWSPLLDRLRHISHIYQKVKVFYSTVDGDVGDAGALVVPSISAFQCYLDLKAKMRNRKTIRLVPLFGAITERTIGAMKRKGECPLGLYYEATSDSVLKKQINKHMNTFDAWEHEQDIAYSLHDINHAIRELELTDQISDVRFFLCDILNVYVQQFPEQEKMGNSYISLLIDNDLLIKCYDNSKDGIFKAARKNETFGHLLKMFRDSDKVTNYIIQHMVLNVQLWKEKFNIDLEDLLESEKQIYLKLQKRAHDIQILSSVYSGSRGSLTFQRNNCITPKNP